MPIQRISISGGPLYEIDRSRSWGSEDVGYHVAQSACLVCPRCTMVWAHLDLGGELWPQGVFCASCGGFDRLSPVAGSIIQQVSYLAFDEPLLEALPEDLLRREFDLHLAEVMRQEGKDHDEKSESKD